MWIILGISAVITALLNLIFSFMGKSVRWLGFLSFSLTALTVCAIYQVAAGSVIQEGLECISGYSAYYGKIHMDIYSIIYGNQWNFIMEIRC